MRDQSREILIGETDIGCECLQARDAGVEEDELRGPVYGDYKQFHQLPSGSTLVKSATGSGVGAGTIKNPLVCVITAEQVCSEVV
jgi:hypothetical protein